MSRRDIRQQIIKACAAVFNSKGYQHVSIPDLEEASGKTKATLYGYFANKGQMATVILDYNLQHKKQAIQQLADDRATITGKLLAHVDVHRPAYAGLMIDGGCPIQNAGATADDTNNQLRLLAARALTDWEQEISLLISAGINNGEFVPDCNADETAWEIISVIEGAILISRTTQNTQLCAQLLDIAESRIKHLSH